MRVIHAKVAPVREGLQAAQPLCGPQAGTAEKRAVRALAALQRLLVVIHEGSTISERQKVLAAARKTQPNTCIPTLLAWAAVLSQTLSFKHKELCFQPGWGLETSFFPFIENQAEKALAEVVQKARHGLLHSRLKERRDAELHCQATWTCRT